jgi:hypothetical protein
MEFNFKQRFNKAKLEQFAQIVNDLSDKIGFRVSSRGWCYIMEQSGFITKSEFDKVEDAINKCRKQGMLPVDFVADEDARAFSGVDKDNGQSMEDILKWMLEDVLKGSKYFTPSWWEGEEYYIQMLVEKTDLKTLFEPVCKKFHIPIANAKGWSSILQRAEYCRRFAEAEANGLTCVLLYCGDHDPDGLRISDTIRKNLEQVSEITWSDDSTGYDPKNLIIERFGLNYDFIIEQDYTWIDNLETGRGGDLASPQHPNNKLVYVQDYLKTVGARKCEANVIVTTPDLARDLCLSAINKYVGQETLDRFAEKTRQARNEYHDLLDEKGIRGPIENIINDL